VLVQFILECIHGRSFNDMVWQRVPATDDPCTEKMFCEQLLNTLAETASTDDHVGCESLQLAERTTGCQHIPFQSEFYTFQ